MADHSTAPQYGRVALHSWTLTDGDPTGSALNSPGNPDRAVQVAGAFVGGTLTLQGSCQSPPVDWATLHDPTGADLVFTAAGIRAVMENPVHLRPILSGAGGGASVSVNLASRSS